MSLKPNDTKFPTEIQQHIAILNARIGNANLALSDLLSAVDAAFTSMAAKIVESQKENAELKEKSGKASKTK